LEFNNVFAGARLLSSKLVAWICNYFHIFTQLLFHLNQLFVVLVSETSLWRDINHQNRFSILKFTQLNFLPINSGCLKVEKRLRRWIILRRNFGTKKAIERLHHYVLKRTHKDLRSPRQGRSNWLLLHEDPLILICSGDSCKLMEFISFRKKNFGLILVSGSKQSIWKSIPAKDFLILYSEWGNSSLCLCSRFLDAYWLFRDSWLYICFLVHSYTSWE
jgi:hypothetical protein